MSSGTRFSSICIHVDLLRVDASERVTVEVPLLLRGEAPGEKEGGVVVHLVHYVEIETSPIAIPEALHININHWRLHQSLTWPTSWTCRPARRW